MAVYQWGISFSGTNARGRHQNRIHGEIIRSQMGSLTTWKSKQKERKKWVYGCRNYCCVVVKGRICIIALCLFSQHQKTKLQCMHLMLDHSFFRPFISLRLRFKGSVNGTSSTISSDHSVLRTADSGIRKTNPYICIYMRPVASTLNIRLEHLNFDGHTQVNPARTFNSKMVIKTSMFRKCLTLITIPVYFLKLMQIFTR